MGGKGHRQGREGGFVQLQCIRTDGGPVKLFSASLRRHFGYTATMFGVRMRVRLVIAILLTIPLIARANPVMIDGQSLIAFGIVAFWALVIESGIATLALVSCGLLIVPAFTTLVVVNVAVFLFGFLPLTSRVSLWLLEPGVVLVDALLIKFVASAPFLQGGEFVGVSWRRALVASLLGNASSFFIGVIGSGAPWIVHKTGGLE